MLTDDYRVRLESFEGPLDLLLFLIRKSEVEITDIPVATITEQYLEFLKDLGSSSRIDIDTAGEFLVMAATLMELKSRMLMPAAQRTAADPQGAPGEKPQEDPRAELVRQLIEYKKYRDAADSLEHRADDWRRRFPTSPAGIDSNALHAALEATARDDLDLEDLDLLDLAEAFQRIAESVNFERLGDHEVKYDDTPIELHAADIVSRLEAEAAAPELELATLLTGRSRSEMVGLFLALLELVRNRRVGVRQDKIDGGIYLRIKAEEGGPAVDGPAVPAGS